MKSRKPKAKREVYRGFTIRMLKPDYLLVDKFRSGHRIRKCFATLGEARTFIDQQTTDIKNLGASAFDLTPKERLDAKEALDLLAGAVPLTAAARFWLKHNPRGDAVTVRQLGDQFLADLQRRECRITTYRERRAKIGRLCADYADRPAASFTASELVAWMDRQGFKGSYRDGYRRMFKAWFNYAVKQGIMEHNPAAGIERVVMDEKLPEFWPVKIVADILHAAERVYPRLVPALALGAFAGLRPGEAAGIQWEAVDLTERIIRVTPETSKVRRSRLVDISDNLAEWLARYHQQAGPVSPPPMSFRRWRERIMQESGVKEWLADGLRHSYATYHFAQHQDAGKLAAQMGHVGGGDVLYRHYRGLATAKDAAKFWSILPATDAKIIELHPTAAPLSATAS